MRLGFEMSGALLLCQTTVCWSNGFSEISGNLEHRTHFTRREKESIDLLGINQAW